MAPPDKYVCRCSAKCICKGYVSKSTFQRHQRRQNQLTHTLSDFQTSFFPTEQLGEHNDPPEVPRSDDESGAASDHEEGPSRANHLHEQAFDPHEGASNQHEVLNLHERLDLQEGGFGLEDEKIQVTSLKFFQADL